MRKNSIELLFELAKTDFKIRYMGSILGYLWSLLKPILLFFVLYTVFSIFMKWDVPNFQLHLLLGIIIWNFFAEGTIFGLNSLTSKASIIKKIYFPRELAVISSILSAFLTLIINLCIFIFVSLAIGINLNINILFLPMYLALLLMLVVGFSFILSILHSKFRDTSQIWEVFLQAGFFLTPIIYPITFIPEKYKIFLFLNPMTQIIEGLKFIMLSYKEGAPSLNWNLYLISITIAIFLFGIMIFKKYSHKIAEEI